MARTWSGNMHLAWWNWQHNFWLDSCSADLVGQLDRLAWPWQTPPLDATTSSLQWLAIVVGCGLWTARGLPNEPTWLDCAVHLGQRVVMQLACWVGGPVESVELEGHTASLPSQLHDVLHMSEQLSLMSKKMTICRYRFLMPQDGFENLQQNLSVGKSYRAKLL